MNAASAIVCTRVNSRVTAATDELEIEYGYENVVTVPMEEADDWPAPTERYS